MDWSAIDWWQLAGYAAALILILLGLIGTVLPGLPGHPLILAGAWLLAWSGGYERVGWLTLTALLLLTILGLAVDWLAQLLGARRAGASRWGVAGALLGTVAGLFMGVVGILFCPLIGATLGEFLAGGDARRASGVGLATWLGMMVGAALKVTIAAVMIGALVLACWR